MSVNHSDLYERLGLTAPMPLAESLNKVVAEDGTIVAENVSQSVAKRIRRDYKNMFGGTYDIIETSTILAGGRTIFSGTPQKFFHNPSHVSSHVPMFDIQIDAHIVAQNLTAEASHDFIVGTVDIFDIFSAITEYLADDYYMNGSTLDTKLAAIKALNFSRAYGATVIKYAPVENSAPTPEPVKDDWKPAKKSGTAVINKVREYRVQGVPQHILDEQGWSIIDVSNLVVRYSGTKETCIDYLSQMKSQGIRLHEMRVVEYNQLEDYFTEVITTGLYVSRRGRILAMGTEAEVMNFIRDGVKRKYLVAEELVGGNIADDIFWNQDEVPTIKKDN